MPPSPSHGAGGAAPWKVYNYTHTEQGIFSPSPYKDRLLPLWRFRTPDIARESAEQIWSVFLEYEKQDDFVGMDNARKFLQMGMTRAKRYANHKGGRKYAPGETAKVETEEINGIVGGRKKRRKLDQSTDPPTSDLEWEGRREKEEASLVFREAWEKAKNWEGYVRRKDDFVNRQKDWKKRQKKSDESANDVRARKKARSEP